MESAVTLVVKTPNQRFKDIHIECDLGWTVKKVKEYLASAHPTNPKSVSQKLIYSGHLLNDEQQLKEVLSKEHDSHTLHIVCPNVHEEQSKENVNKPQSAGGAEGQTPFTQSNDGLRHRHTTSGAQNTTAQDGQQWSMYNNQYSAFWQNYQQNLQQQQQQYLQFPYQNQGLPMNAAYPAQQLFQWQMNMMAMYQQGMQGYPFMNTATMPPSPLTPAATPVTPNFQPVQQGPGFEEPQAAAPAQGQAAQQAEQVVNNEQRNQNVAMNAGGAMFDDDDDENGEGRRDWLDWIHTVIRAGVMLSIMYFYSSTVRIMMISLLGFIIYLYQAGWLTFQRQRRDQEEDANQNQNQDEQDGNTNEEDENRENPEDGEEETDSNSPQGNIPPQRLSTFRAHVNILYTFFTSFFTSLVPQAAQ